MHHAERGEDKQARDWARLHDRDGEDIHADYIPLCRPCHIAYDGSGHRVPHSEETKALLSARNTGYRHTPEAVEKIRAASLSREVTPGSLAALAASRAERAGQSIPAEQRERISAALRGNVNASGKRSAEALENIRRGQRERRRRERGEGVVIGDDID